MFYREKMVLYNVLNQEVVFQEYFCNLLQFNAFKNLFINFVNSSLICNETIKYENFTTEKVLDKEKGRADLFLKFDKKEFIFEIKNKCYTGLTKNQPESYLDYLNDKNEHLFFIIPRQYSHIEEIKTRWNAKNSFEKITKQILFWEDFVEQLGKIELNTEIKMFYDFCLYWFNMRVVEFNEEEKMLLNKENNELMKFIPTMLNKLEMIINNIASNSGMKIDNNTIGYNYSKTINDEYIVYFGVDYDHWKSKGEPLTLIIQKKDNSDFELKLNSFVLERIYYAETSESPEQTGYRVTFNSTLGNDDFQENTKKLIDDVFKELEKK